MDYRCNECDTYTYVSDKDKRKKKNYNRKKKKNNRTSHPTKYYEFFANV